MDKRVYQFFIVIFVLSAGLFSFRYANHEACPEVDFSLSELEPIAGSAIQFKDATTGAREWSWDFGDGSAKKNRQSELHIFDKEGYYEVNLMVNNSCEKTRTVYVKPAVKILDPTKFPEFYLPKRIKVGDRLVVSDKSDRASSWEWRFGESSKVDATTRTAAHIYQQPGFYTVSLIINGEIDYLKKKMIEVKPKAIVAENPFKIIEEPKGNALNLPDAPTIEEPPKPVETLEVEEDITVPFAVIEDVPIFPGCEGVNNKKTCFEELMQNHIRKHFLYPEIAEENGVQGRVDATFTISKDGLIRNIKLRGPDKTLEEEVKRILYLLPKMTPGKQKGRPVNVPFSIPVTFKLQEEEPEETVDNRPTLNENIIINDLRQISRGRLGYKDFSKYFCEDDDPFVIFNGNSLTFQRFCNEVKGKKIILKRIRWGTENKCLFSFEVND